MNKNLSFYQKQFLSFQDKNMGELYIYYDNNELCLAIDNYTFDKRYLITSKSELFIPMKKLLREIKKVDMIRNYASNRFEWISEGYGMPEAQNRLMIYEQEGIIFMYFIKNNYNAVDESNTCSIHFSLTDSKNKLITQAFNDMFINLCNQKNKSKTKTRNK